MLQVIDSPGPWRSLWFAPNLRLGLRGRREGVPGGARWPTPGAPAALPRPLRWQALCVSVFGFTGAQGSGGPQGARGGLGCVRAHGALRWPLSRVPHRTGRPPGLAEDAGVEGRRRIPSGEGSAPDPSALPGIRRAPGREPSRESPGPTPRRSARDLGRDGSSRPVSSLVGRIARSRKNALGGPFKEGPF